MQANITRGQTCAQTNGRSATQDSTRSMLCTLSHVLAVADVMRECKGRSMTTMVLRMWHGGST